MRISDSLTISFHPVTLNAFRGDKGYWTNYKAVQEAGITSLKVEPVLFFQYLSTDLTLVKLDLYFREDDLPEEKFNIVYGDGQFEKSLHLFMAQFFPPETFDKPSYTEAGMQGDNYVSMEYRPSFVEVLRSQSSHFLMELQHNPLIREISL